MIFFGIYELMNTKKKGNYWLVAGGVLLILSHTITTIYTAIFAIFFIIFNYKKTINWTFWKSIIIDLLLILLLTSFYTIPLIEHKLYGDYLIYDADAMNSNAQWVYQNTNNPHDWIQNEFLHSETPHEDLIFSFGVVITFLTVISIFCYKKMDNKYKDMYIVFFILAILSLFMTTKAFPWLLMPQVLTVIQFAWRLNGFFIFFISLICGINAIILTNMITQIINQKKDKSKIGNLHHSNIYILITIIIAISTVGWFNASPYIKQFDSEVDKQFEKIG